MSIVAAKAPLAPWWRSLELPLESPEAIEDLVGFVSGSWLWLTRRQVRDAFDGYRGIADDFALVRNSYGELVRAVLIMARDHLVPAVDHLATLKDLSGWDGLSVYQLSGFTNPAPFPATLIALAKRVGAKVRGQENALGACERIRRNQLVGIPADPADVDLITTEVE